MTDDMKTDATPLNDDQQSLLDASLILAEGLETGAIELLSDDESDMLEKASRFGGLVLMSPSHADLFTATQLVFKGLVRMSGGDGYVVVSAVRGEGE